jgi:hypothetical protein
MVMRVKLHAFVFPGNTVPRGALSKDMRSQACWYFYVLAQKQREIVGDSTDDQAFRLTDEDMWMDTHYVQTAHTVAMMYGLESPDEFAKAWGEVTEEAKACGLPTPHDSYMRLVPRVIIQ